MREQTNLEQEWQYAQKLTYSSGKIHRQGYGLAIVTRRMGTVGSSRLGVVIFKGWKRLIRRYNDLLIPSPIGRCRRIWPMNDSPRQGSGYRMGIDARRSRTCWKLYASLKLYTNCDWNTLKVMYYSFARKYGQRQTSALVKLQAASQRTLHTLSNR